MAGPDFERFAAEALGTDDPAKLSALKEAIMACMTAGFKSLEKSLERLAKAVR